jgi:hypothetical protein
VVPESERWLIQGWTPTVTALISATVIGTMTLTVSRRLPW